MNRNRRAGAGLVHAVDVRGVELEALARAVPAPPRRRADDQPVLHQLALHDRDGAAGDIVVVAAGVVAVHPGDDPQVNVVVAPEL
jgi:hypothetical protein